MSARWSVRARGTALPNTPVRWLRRRRCPDSGLLAELNHEGQTSNLLGVVQETTGNLNVVSRKQG